MKQTEKILSKITGWSVDAIQTDGPPVQPSSALAAMQQCSVEFVEWVFYNKHLWLNKSTSELFQIWEESK